METGQLLVAVPGKLDPNFDATVVYLFDTVDGAAGVVLNRPTDIAVTDVMPELSSVVAEPNVVFHGGPVQVEHGLILGKSGAKVTPIDTAVAAGGSPHSIRVFAGYAGWESGQLQHEITEGGWFVLDAKPDDVLTPEPLALWRAVFARQRGPIRRYRTFPDDPSLN